MVCRSRRCVATLLGLLGRQLSPESPALFTPRVLEAGLELQNARGKGAPKTACAGVLTKPLRDFGFPPAMLMSSRFESGSFTGETCRLWRASSLHTTALTSQGLIYNYDVDQPPKLLVVQPRTYPQIVLKANLLEALRLASSLEELRGDKGDKHEELLPPYILVQCPESGKSKKRRKRVRADAYFGSGTIENVRTEVVAMDSQDGLDAVFVNATLTAVQQRNLERSWGKPVLDRVGLIIEIFGAHAETKEARLQVELAALNYKKSRLVRMPTKDGRLAFGMDFEAEVVSARGRGGGGGRGFMSGAGETEIQLQRQRISERRDRLLALLKEVRRTRSLHRDARRKLGMGSHGKQLPVVAVVGYTNAGKSSLVAALSRSKLYIDDKLFATLDPRSRSVILPSGQSVILSDTVGFIADLPVQLVEAFHATLEEVAEADFLLHVIDSSAPNAEEQRLAVLKVLESIGVSKEKIRHCMIEVWNKVDLAVESSFKSESLKLNGVESAGCRLIPMTDASEASDDEEKSHQVVIDSRESAEDSEGEDASENLSLSWCSNGIPRIGTSAVEGIGLKDLLQLLDKKLGTTPESYAESGT